MCSYIPDLFFVSFCADPCTSTSTEAQAAQAQDTGNLFASIPSYQSSPVLSGPYCCCLRQTLTHHHCGLSLLLGNQPVTPPPEHHTGPVLLGCSAYLPDILLRSAQSHTPANWKHPTTFCASASPSRDKRTATNPSPCSPRQMLLLVVRDIVRYI